MTASCTRGAPVDHRLPSGPTTVIAANCGDISSLNVALTDAGLRVSSAFSAGSSAMRVACAAAGPAPASGPSARTIVTTAAARTLMRLAGAEDGGIADSAHAQAGHQIGVDAVELAFDGGMGRSALWRGHVLGRGDGGRQLAEAVGDRSDELLGLGVLRLLLGD